MPICNENVCTLMRIPEIEYNGMEARCGFSLKYLNDSLIWIELIDKQNETVDVELGLKMLRYLQEKYKD